MHGNMKAHYQQGDGYSRTACSYKAYNNAQNQHGKKNHQTSSSLLFIVLYDVSSAIISYFAGKVNVI